MRQLQEKYIKIKRSFSLVDLEKALYKAHWNVVWRTVSKFCVKEWLVRVMKSVYNNPSWCKGQQWIHWQLWPKSWSSLLFCAKLLLFILVLEVLLQDSGTGFSCFSWISRYPCSIHHRFLGSKSIFCYPCGHQKQMKWSNLAILKKQGERYKCRECADCSPSSPTNITYFGK